MFWWITLECLIQYSSIIHNFQYSKEHFIIYIEKAASQHFATGEHHLRFTTDESTAASASTPTPNSEKSF